MRNDFNPFSTRYVRPGAVPFRFDTPDGCARLIARLRDQRWRGQLVGAHGSGKSTLLHTLAPELARAGRQPVWFTMHLGQRRLPRETSIAAPTWTESTQLIVDGYEQLGFAARVRLYAACRRARAGLLVTTHRPVRPARRLPVLLHVACSLETLQQLVAQVLIAAPAGIIEPADVARCYHASGGNARDTLFGLYDLYERRRSQPP